MGVSVGDEAEVGVSAGGEAEVGVSTGTEAEVYSWWSGSGRAPVSFVG